jgi:hypothetical protein
MNEEQVKISQVSTSSATPETQKTNASSQQDDADADDHNSLSPEHQIQMHLIANRTDEVETIIWDEKPGPSARKTSSWICAKIEEVFAAILSVTTSKMKVTIKLRTHDKRHLQTR